MASRLRRRTWHADDAAKSHVARGRIHGLWKPRRGPIATTVARRAEMRAALDHLARNLDVWLRGIVAVVGARSARIVRHAARLDRFVRMLRHVEVGRPLP